MDRTHPLQRDMKQDKHSNLDGLTLIAEEDLGGGIVQSQIHLKHAGDVANVLQGVDAEMARRTAEDLSRGMLHDFFLVSKNGVRFGLLLRKRGERSVTLWPLAQKA